MNFNKRIIFLNLIVLVLFSCSNFQKIPKSGYFYPEFQCLKGEGWKNKEKYNVYIKNWNLFRNLYNKKNGETGQAKTVIVGNSLVHAFSDSLIEREFPGKGVVGRGIGGDMSDLLLKRIQENVLSLNPQTIIIEIGGNDLIQGKCLSYIKSNVLQLIERIRLNNPDTKIILTSVPPTRVMELNAISPIYNSFLSRLPEQFYNLYYVDLWRDMMETDKPIIKKEYSFDNIHFNEKGYKLWGKLLRPYLNKK
ncbi:MAG: lipase [Leptospiraceae bacterium]|nr:lipase [Leptospiraceae bacterium]MCP5495208.1 lipase [Leptospiraceae bacterium]